MSADGRKNTTDDTIRLDAEGNWYQGYYPILHDRTCKYLHKNIALDQKGRYYLAGEEKPIFIEVEDAPYWITRIEKTIAGYLITLTDETIELLNPETLWTKKKEALYCLVKGGTFSARFQRNPYYELTHQLEKRGNKFYLFIGEKRYPIEIEPPRGFRKMEGERKKAGIAGKSEKKGSRVKLSKRPQKKAAKKRKR